MNRKFHDWGGTLAAFALVIAVNVLANALPIGGQTTGEMSARYPTLFTPAGYTFSIWALIYSALAVYAVYQALPAQRNNALVSRVNRIFQVNCLANASWIFAWHYDQLILSLILMGVILGTLIWIARTLANAKEEATTGMRLFVGFPFSLYLGWISVATLANISIVQVGYGWEDLLLVEADWSLVKLALAGFIGAVMILRRSDLAFGAVVAWAAVGISVKQAASPQVSGAALTVAMVAGALVAVEGFRKLKTLNKCTASSD